MKAKILVATTVLVLLAVCPGVVFAETCLVPEWREKDTQRYNRETGQYEDLRRLIVCQKGVADQLIGGALTPWEQITPEWVVENQERWNDFEILASDPVTGTRFEVSIDILLSDILNPDFRPAMNSLVEKAHIIRQAILALFAENSKEEMTPVFSLALRNVKEQRFITERSLWCSNSFLDIEYNGHGRGVWRETAVRLYSERDSFLQRVADLDVLEAVTEAAFHVGSFCHLRDTIK